MQFAASIEFGITYELAVIVFANVLQHVFVCLFGLVHFGLALAKIRTVWVEINVVVEVILLDGDPSYKFGVCANVAHFKRYGTGDMLLDDCIQGELRFVNGRGFWTDCRGYVCCVGVDGGEIVITDGTIGRGVVLVRR